MILDRVTITGADNSVTPEDLVHLSQKFPFVEWGILLSKSQEGGIRFPSLAWMEKLKDIIHTNPSIKLSGHLCGKWVRDVCAGDATFVTERPSILDMFDRIQLNFHAIVHTTSIDALKNALSKFPDHIQYIFQLDNINNDILSQAQNAGIDAVPLFDLSGGAGILPKSWPKAINGYCGYAGGLSPENVAEQIAIIREQATNNRIWIDVERHVRSQDDKQFDLSKVRKFLFNTEPFVNI